MNLHDDPHTNPWRLDGRTYRRTCYVTGGFGFIGSHLVARLLGAGHHVVVIDSATYAARPAFVRAEAKRIQDDEERCFGGYVEEVVDVRSAFAVAQVFRRWGPGDVFHLAAESHVCRSIASPENFVDTNIVGTFAALRAFRGVSEDEQWTNCRFIHVSTDEVFGELRDDEPAFTERSQVQPRSPYAASKAASDHLALSYFHTYRTPVIVTNCSNNYGPNQHEEKLIPATIRRLEQGKPARLYGSGTQRRDWLWVGDHVDALILLRDRGQLGQRYCIGGDAERTNIETVRAVAEAMGVVLGREFPLSVEYTNDRPTDDKRYSIDAAKLKALGWRPTKSFAEHLETTVRHYVEQQ